MKDILIQIIGTYVLNDTAEGIAQIDFVWLLSAILLIVCVNSVYRLIGLLFTTSLKR